jgi:dTDP-4-dehydrorhamnose 3,5-epimerase
MTFEPCDLEGVRLIEFPRFADQRGEFIKTFQATLFAEHGIEFHLAEQFFSTSKAGVLRGLHFQIPPFDHAKLVFCLTGRILDVVVDLRKSSPAFGKFAAFTLDAEKAHGLFIPSGFAHGFYAETDATVFYNVSSVHQPSADAGIHWQSIGYPWPNDAPIISERDGKFPALEAFQSPF